MTIKSILIFSLLISISSAQQYPRWFLFQGKISCPSVSVGIVKTGYYQESTKKSAVLHACELAAIYQHAVVSGEQAFWATEGGTFALDAHYDIVYDTSLAEQYTEQFSVLDYFSDSHRTFVLAGDSSCSIASEFFEKVSLKSIPKPQWVERTPSLPAKVFVVGFSEEYEYEASSWIAAQNAAFKELARSIRSSQKSVVRSDEYEQHDIRREEIDVPIHDVCVEARWRDTKKKIYYVLLSMKK